MEHRALGPVEVRAATPRSVTARVMRYGVVDDYQTVFDAGCFAESLAQKLPRMVWAHDWKEPLGRGVDYTDSPTALEVTFEFDDPEAVPRARQAHAQLLSGTLNEWSVGFAREDTYEDDQGVTHFAKARLDECSIVLSGAVPATDTLAVRRSQAGQAEARRLARLLADGEITAEQYRTGLAFNRTVDDDVAELEREADEALEDVDHHLRDFDAKQRRDG